MDHFSSLHRGLMSYGSVRLLGMTIQRPPAGPLMPNGSPRAGAGPSGRVGARRRHQRGLRARMLCMSKFRVNDTFALESRQLFVLAGSIVEGQIRAGMIVNVSFNSSLVISEQIHSVEFCRGTDGREDVCLCITYEDSDELRVWNALNVQDEVLDVVPFNSNGSAYGSADSQ